MGNVFGCSRTLPKADYEHVAGQAHRQQSFHRTAMPVLPALVVDILL
jgi:hypothetical protein